MIEFGKTPFFIFEILNIQCVDLNLFTKTLQYLKNITIFKKHL